MWTSACARRVVDALVAHERADRVLSYSAEFVGMVSSLSFFFFLFFLVDERKEMYSLFFDGLF